MDTEWQQTFRKRMGSFRSLRPAHAGEIALSIKVRVVSGCFHREHSPRAYALIDTHLGSLSTDVEFLEHESGPEILAYLAAATAGLTLAKSVIDLITAIIKARSDGVKKGDRADAPLELIVRCVDETREYREQVALRIGHKEPINARLVEKQVQEAIHNLFGPSEAVTLERARSLANEAMFTIALQRRRIRSNEPEDDTFVMRWWADLQFFIVALRRLRRTAELAGHVASVKDSMSLALKTFDDALPKLSTMRNVGEHIDAYALDSPKRHHEDVYRQSLQVGSWDGVTYQWLGESLNIDIAHDAAYKLFSAISAASKERTALLKADTGMVEHPKKQPPTYEQALNEAAERRERELQEDDEPKTDVDKLLDEQKRGETKTPDYDEL
jgi:hypothetical protein